jgi:hypothetical protein
LPEGGNGGAIGEDQMDAIFRSIASSQEELRKECERDYATKAAFDEHSRLNIADFDQLNRRIDGLQDEM